MSHRICLMITWEVRHGRAGVSYDSFPARRFGGNVAGVVFLDSPAPRGWAQHIAAELAAPTTGFVDMPMARRRDARVRFFTPQQGIGACGHVTVAIATALAEVGVRPMGEAAVSTAGGRYPLSLSDCGTAGSGWRCASARLLGEDGASGNVQIGARCLRRLAAAGAANTATSSAHGDVLAAKSPGHCNQNLTFCGRLTAHQGRLLPAPNRSGGAGGPRSDHAQ